MTSCTPDSTVVVTCSYLYLKPGSIRFKIDRLRADFKSSRSSRFGYKGVPTGEDVKRTTLATALAVG